MLEQGKTVDEIEVATQKIDDKLRQGVHTVREILRDLVARLDETPVAPEVAFAMVQPSERAALIAASLVRKLRDQAINGVMLPEKEAE